MYRFSCIVIICIVGTHVAFSKREIEPEKYYQIEGHDGYLISIGGGNSRNVRVIMEEPQGTSPRQRFWVGSGETHEIRPEMQNTWNNLLLDLDLESSLVFQQNRNWRRHQLWKITPFPKGNQENEYVVQNDRSGQCLTNPGKDNQLYGAICDLSLANQTWIFRQVTLLN